MPSFFTYNLVAQYNTLSYCHKTFENKLKWRNLVVKLFFRSLSKLYSVRGVTQVLRDRWVYLRGPIRAGGGDGLKVEKYGI